MSGVGGPRMWADLLYSSPQSSKTKGKQVCLPSLSPGRDSVIQPLGSEFQSPLPLDHGLSAYPYLTLAIRPLALY